MLKRYLNRDYQHNLAFYLKKDIDASPSTPIIFLLTSFAFHTWDAM